MIKKLPLLLFLALLVLMMPGHQAAAEIDVADFTLQEPIPEFLSFFGRSVATGDVNGDGREDIIGGAPSAFVAVGPDLFVAGEAFVFLGGQPFDPAADFTLRDPVPEHDARFGESVAMGDVNGDGKDDVIVGAFLSDVGSFSEAGEVFVFLGGDPFDAIADFTLQNPDPVGLGAWLGFSVATGDVNGDGKDDVIAGGPRNDKALVFLGSATFDTTADATLRFPAPFPVLFEEFGDSVAAGDVNGDLRDDIIVGSGTAAVGLPSQAGKAFVFLGGDPFDATSDFTLSDPNPEAFASFGNAVGAGDVTGDGKADIIVGAFQSDVASFGDAGEVFVFLGGDPFDAASDFTLQDPTPGALGFFGRSLTTGDIDGDGKNDIIVGRRDAAYVFLGSSPFNASADLTLLDPSLEVGSRFGVSMAAGDVNGDGFSDAVVGADSSDVGIENEAGEAFVFLGDPDHDNDGVYAVDEGPCGGNSLNASIRPERIDTPGVDDDGDTLIDEPLPPGAEAYDCDGDGFIGSAEASITTSDQDPCGHNGWPADLQANNRLDIGDFGSFLFPLGANDGHGSFAYFGHTVPDAGRVNEERWNLDTVGPGVGLISIADLNALNPAVNAPSARPPMFGGQPAFFTNLGQCPYAP